jgi:hypothetical protein
MIEHNKSEPDKLLKETINELLKSHFGVDTVTGLPIWRVSWAPDQYEKRHGTWEDYTQGGIYLKTVTETREVPKYPHLRRHYVLEQLVGIPQQNKKELPSSNMSYEPIHPFWDGQMNPLPPKWEVCKFIIDTIHAAMGQGSLRKYVDPDEENNGLEQQNKNVKEIYDGLYGNETATGDALAYGTGVFLDSTKQLDKKSH